jgi:hypothetical protein
MGILLSLVVTLAGTGLGHCPAVAAALLLHLALLLGVEHPQRRWCWPHLQAQVLLLPQLVPLPLLPSVLAGPVLTVMWWRRWWMQEMCLVNLSLAQQGLPAALPH